MVRLLLLVYLQLTSLIYADLTIPSRNRNIPQTCSGQSFRNLLDGTDTLSYSHNPTRAQIQCRSRRGKPLVIVFVERCCFGKIPFPIIAATRNGHARSRRFLLYSSFQKQKVSLSRKDGCFIQRNRSCRGSRGRGVHRVYVRD